ncbi:3D domain-containing protein [Clostridium sp.]|uniref:3D domain-containing protein n=1 Tax=Clostridium sp. TaxID=1506 RepID=UPI003D6CEFD7
MMITIITTLTTFMCFAGKNNILVVDGEPMELLTYQETLHNTLSSAEINDTLPINVTVFVDNKELNISSSEKTIALMLKAEKISLSTTDRVSPSIGTILFPGMNVIITRVKISTIKQTAPIAFKTITRKDINTLKSKIKVLQIGVPGQKSVTVNVTYENGKEVSRKVISEKVIKAAKSKIIVQGTLPKITFSRGGSLTPSKDILTVKATAYSADEMNNAYTASGIKNVRNANGYSTIAVDPRIIPMGTKLYVEGYGYAIAADKGSAIKGNFIDVFFNTNKEAVNWGVKYIKVQILD